MRGQFRIRALVVGGNGFGGVGALPAQPNWSITRRHGAERPAVHAAAIRRSRRDRLEDRRAPLGVPLGTLPSPDGRPLPQTAGRQYVVIAAGGSGKFGDGDALVAFGLPR